MRSRLRLIETADPAEVERVVRGAVSLFLKGYAPSQPPQRLTEPSVERTSA
jgi:hypothetical protein